MEKPKPTLLLTGASGMLGGYLKEVFSDYSVTTLGRSEDDDIKASFGNGGEVPQLGYYDLVVHTASDHDVERAIDVNFEGTRKLLAALGKNPPRCFIFVSCAEVYGRNYGGEISEKNHLWIEDKFGQSKVLAAREVESWCKEHGVISTILRPAPMFGRGMKGKWAETFNAVESGRYILVRGNSTVCSIVLAYDVARVVREIHTIGGIYNVADPRHHRFADIIEAMGANSGRFRTPYRLPAKWARLAARIGDRLPLSGILPTSASLAFQLTSLTYDCSALLDALPGFRFLNTVDVIARRDPGYPYSDPD